MKRVTGIGGIFFKCSDPAKVNEWYKTHLGLDTSPYGAKFDWQDVAKAQTKAIRYGALFLTTPNILNPQKKSS